MFELNTSMARKLWPIPFLLFALAASPALAVQPTVKTVPWVASNPLIPHDAFSGVAHTLKGTADVQGANFQYSWDFGDGSAPLVGTVTNQYVIPASHAYVGNPGDIFSASLTVTDTNTGESASNSYFVAIRDVTLETEVNAAIDQGLWYLHTTMTRGTSSSVPTGRWVGGFTGSGNFSNSAANILAFEVNGHLESGGAGNPYTETVARGLADVFLRLVSTGLAAQTNPIGTFNPDANGNTFAVRLNQGNEFYQGGMIMDAIIASGTPGAIAPLGPVNVIGVDYGTIIQDMVDYYSYCQYDGAQGGGWRYSCNAHPDGSANQWAAIGMIAAERSFGATIPQIVKDWNKVWVDYAHNIATGISGYITTSTVWGPFATTPSGTVQMAMDGIGRGDPLWDTSETYLRNTFCNNTGSAGTSIRDYYYGWFSFTKSMLLHDSNDDGVAEPITDVAQQPAGTLPLDWYSAEAANGDACDGVARQLVNDQNAAGYWYAHNFSSSQFSFETGWAIVMLNRTVFASGVPVAVAAATPNPAVVGQTVNLDGSSSFHQDSAKTIISWDWDLDDDGAFDDASGAAASTSFPALGNYPIGLQVCDDATPTVCDDTIVVVRVTIPPVAPTADADGPYVFCPQAQPWFLDGTGSVNPDEGGSEPGQPGDTIQSYAWELNNSGQFDDAFGAQPDVTAYFQAQGVGNYLIQLRVTDTTATSYPSSNMGDLSDTDSAQVNVADAGDVACGCIDDLTSRPKSGKIQLVWSDIAPAGGYNVYRSTTQGGPYSFIANTTSSYSTYLDTGLTNGTTYHYVVRPAALNGDELCQSNETSATPVARRRR